MSTLQVTLCDRLDVIRMHFKSAKPLVSLVEGLALNPLIGPICFRPLFLPFQRFRKLGCLLDLGAAWNRIKTLEIFVMKRVFVQTFQM